MALITTVRSALSALGTNIVTARDALKVAWSQPPKRTNDLWADTFHKSPMLDPVHMIASDVAGTGYKIFNKQQYRKDAQNAEPYGDNPIFTLLENPMPDHPEIDWYQVMYVTSTYYEIIGDAFWLIDRDARGRPVGVYPIPPSWVLLTPTRDVPFFRIQPMGNTSHIYFNADPSDVIWFKSPDILNPYGRGRGRAEPIGDGVETHEYSEKYAKGLMYNDATPPIILEMPGISKPQADEFKENWMQRVGGWLNARKPAIVGQPGFKVHQLSTSPKEMDLLESRKYLIQTANEHWCVPPEMRGNLQNSNRSTIDSAFYLWSKNVVTKRLRIFEAILNKQFVPLFDKNALWKYDEIVPEDNAAKMEIVNRGLELGTITRGEWRRVASSCGVTLPPDSVRDDVYLTGFMVQEVPANKETPLPEPPAPPEPEPPAPSEPEKSLDLDAVIKDLNEMNAKMTRVKSSFSEDQKIALWKAFDKRAESTESLFVSAVKKFADDQGKRVESAIKGVTSDKDISSALDGVFIPESDTALKRALAPAWLESMKVGRTHAQSLLAKKAASVEAVTNEWFNKWVETNGLKKAKEINDTTHKSLLAKLQAVFAVSIDARDGLAATVDKLITECNGVYDNMSKSRAVLIARTESASTVNAGTQVTYKTEGVQRKEWIAVRDSRTRDAHKDPESGPQIVDIDKPFIIDGEKLMYPGDPAGSASNICNCRCTMAPVFDD